MDKIEERRIGEIAREHSPNGCSTFLVGLLYAILIALAAARESSISAVCANNDSYKCQEFREKTPHRLVDLFDLKDYTTPPTKPTAAKGKGNRS